MKPLVPEDINHVRPGVYLYRAAAAYLRAGANRSGRLSPEGAARQMFPDDRATLRLVERASVPATTTGAGWADALAQQSIFDAIQSPTSLSASATLIERALHVNFDGLAAVVVPGRVVDAAQAGAWAREGGPAPIKMLYFSSVTLTPRKLSVAVIITREMAESSNIEAVMRQTLGEAAGLSLDAAMLSNAPGDDSRPPGLFNTVAPLVAAPAGPDAMVRDLGNLINALAVSGAGVAPVVVAAPAQACALRYAAGPLFNVPILSSGALATASPARTVIMLETSSLVVGFDSVREFNVSRAGTVHMEEDSPQQITDGAMANPVRSMFQTDSLALRLTVAASWAMRAPHVAWVTNVNWP